METDDGPSETPIGEADVNMQDAKGAAETPATENGAPESGENLTSEADEKSVQMDTDSKVCGLCLVYLICMCCSRARLFFIDLLILSNVTTHKLCSSIMKHINWSS